MTDNPAKATTVHLGEFRIEVVSGGRFKMDGGAMFGVVPKALWSSGTEVDGDNNVEQATNCLFVDTGRNRVLIDTGYGSKLGEKQRDILASQPGAPLIDSLQKIGVGPEDLDTVILSHLHFDHAGGATSFDGDGQLKPTFANARYVVQRREWMMATADLPERSGAYSLDNFLPLQGEGCLQLIDGPVEIVPGIWSIPTGGHTPGHQTVKIRSSDNTAVYLGDLCPTTNHLPIRWGMSFDLDVLELRRRKAELLTTITERNFLAFFDHDPLISHARLRRDSKRDFAVEEKGSEA